MQLTPCSYVARCGSNHDPQDLWGCRHHTREGALTANLLTSTTRSARMRPQRKLTSSEREREREKLWQLTNQTTVRWSNQIKNSTRHISALRRWSRRRRGGWLCIAAGVQKPTRMSCVISAHYVLCVQIMQKPEPQKRREENEDHDDSQVRGNPNYLRSAAVTATVTREKKKSSRCCAKKAAATDKKIRAY